MHPKSNNSQIDNSFAVYKMMNPNSICGYPYLAVNESQKNYISISDKHFSISQWYWEVSDWLENDYVKIQQLIQFDYSAFENCISNNFNSTDFDLTAYSEIQEDIHTINMAFGKYENYYEIELSFENHTFKKQVKGLKTNKNFIEITADGSTAFLEISNTLSVLNKLKNSLFRNEKN